MDFISINNQPTINMVTFKKNWKTKYIDFVGYPSNLKRVIRKFKNNIIITQEYKMLMELIEILHRYSYRRNLIRYYEKNSLVVDTILLFKL